MTCAHHRFGYELRRLLEGRRGDRHQHRLDGDERRRRWGGSDDLLREPKATWTCRSAR